MTLCNRCGKPCETANKDYCSLSCFKAQMILYWINPDATLHQSTLASVIGATERVWYESIKRKTNG